MSKRVTITMKDLMYEDIEKVAKSLNLTVQDYLLYLATKDKEQRTVNELKF